MEKKRIFFIDYIKAFSISLIIISHCIGWWEINEALNKAIVTIHVPIFFLAAGVLKGYLKKEESFLPFIRKRSKQLLIPYFWFSIYNSAVKLSMMVIGVGGRITPEVLRQEAVAFFITGNGTVWFLMTLMLSESLFVWLKSFKNNWLLIVVAGLFAIIPFCWSISNPVLVVLNRAMCAFSLIVLGWYVAMFLRERKLVFRLGVVLMAIWLILVYNTDWDYTFFGGKFNNIFTSLPTMLSGCFAVIFLFCFISKRVGFFQYIGKNSLILMLMHPTFLLIGMYGIYPHLYLHGNIQFVLFFICLIIFVYSLSLLCIPVIHKFVPFVIGKKRNL
jgi:fucose 4-O-acetylase-like acetyltransferase